MTAGRLAEQDGWTGADGCPMEYALQFIGTHSAMVLLREAFWGGRRFDDLARRAGVTEQIAAKRLRELVDAGLLQKQPYREPGQRTRYEYVLTDRGRDLFPVLISLIEFGRLLQAQSGTELIHKGCGESVVPQVRCSAGHDVSFSDVVIRKAKRRRREV
ncbi:helix-turn-helix domain-containing protein [Mycobacterium sp. TY814]|uniref:winged helix-turn-helix transcriptional regulator n=1 Tax=unclassified Mycobacterium TaxID=2642494 RepID=UPI00274277FE|nr:helix-turn-helix domain-containing protein [Mycobacterium sp. TY814]MDP7723317.1 helix-turn-helix domain-containing protein [Mycobacterium sp. TY814]